MDGNAVTPTTLVGVEEPRCRLRQLQNADATCHVAPHQKTRIRGEGGVVEVRNHVCDADDAVTEDTRGNLVEANVPVGCGDRHAVRVGHDGDVRDPNLLGQLDVRQRQHTVRVRGPGQRESPRESVAVA